MSLAKKEKQSQTKWGQFKVKLRKGKRTKKKKKKKLEGGGRKWKQPSQTPKKKKKGNEGKFSRGPGGVQRKN